MRTTDVSVQYGGRDAVSAPAEMVAGSLGAWKAITVQECRDSRGFTDKDVAVSVTLVLADDPKHIDGVAVEVESPDGFSEEMLEAVKRVTELCPVRETLRIPPRINIEFVM